MVLNIFSLTIKITKQKISHERALQNAQANKNFEEARRNAEINSRIRHY